MIEIIKYGKQFATCPNCHAVLRFDQEDIKTEAIQYTNEVEKYIKCEVKKYIKCPVCKNNIYECNFEEDKNSDE